MLLRDRQRLAKIKEYCEDIQETISRFGATFETFQKDRAYQQIAAFCVLQIGELVGTLSEEYRTKTKAHMPWQQIKGLRNVVVHDYGSVDAQVMWNVLTEKIPELLQFCRGQLSDSES